MKRDAKPDAKQPIGNHGECEDRETEKSYAAAITRQPSAQRNCGQPSYRLEACCCDSGLSVTSDALGMVATGGELTLFEAVDRLVV